ncbi:hypothetical protein N7532_010649 [Penicillium argentinense]|uniref:Uncharacterized protein n=1 Tax=Penicillium argentinense TaxID=1131581 RepID=A0A9W9EPZ9_9EURO|nr:uncharacterized protein N7532_010649 [Penicillium argentinense]KAJ5085878.1 hypothetical protein N7532_010649 [Penicillium argentinense]
MVKKKRPPTLQEKLEMPWCYYCNREFVDLVVLTTHQKTKHFRCDDCARRLNTAGGLKVHMSQVHKKELTEVAGAIEGRRGLDVEIFGMEGIPAEAIRLHENQIRHEYAEMNREHMERTGNPMPGSGIQPPPSKKPKLDVTEDVSNMKKRLAEHRAKRAAEAAAAAAAAATEPSSGNGTPASPASNTPVAAAAAQNVPNALSLAAGLVPGQPYSYHMPYGGVAAVAAPVPYGGSPGSYSPATPGHAPGAAASPLAGNSLHAPSAHGYGATPNPNQPTPTTDSSARASASPLPAGLPNRPQFEAPAVNFQQMQQIHMGHPLPAASPAAGDTLANGSNGDNVTSGATAEAKVETTAGATEKVDKPAKKPANVRLIYSDKKISPEEKMAALPRYAFNRAQFPDNTALGELPASTVTGPIRDQDTVLDPAQ